MIPGKNICNELKAVRRSIADENGIELDIPECTYQGPCRGTCPRCESELRYLENALADRLRNGMAAKVAGIALALAAPATVGAQNTEVPTGHECQTQDSALCRRDAGAPMGETPVHQIVPLQEPIVGKPAVMSAGLAVNPPQVVADSVRVTGTVVDGKTKEPLPFVNIVVMRDGKPVCGATTDYDGVFNVSLIPGKYSYEVHSVGYATASGEVTVVKDRKLDIVMEATGNLLGMIPVEEVDSPIEIGSPGQTQVIERDGVKVKAQY